MQQGQQPQQQQAQHLCWRCWAELGSRRNQALKVKFVILRLIWWLFSLSNGVCVWAYLRFVWFACCLLPITVNLTLNHRFFPLLTYPPHFCLMTEQWSIGYCNGTCRYIAFFLSHPSTIRCEYSNHNWLIVNERASFSFDFF